MKKYRCDYTDYPDVVPDVVPTNREDGVSFAKAKKEVLREARKARDDHWEAWTVALQSLRKMTAEEVDTRDKLRKGVNQ